MKKCGRCGGGLRRVHRTLFERLSSMAKYRCRECQGAETLPRLYRFHFGGQCRCHRCGTYRVTKLRSRDKIDPMEPGLLNLLERLVGGKLYHCRFCRFQFWDRRTFMPAASAPRAPETPANTAEQSEATKQG